MIPCKKLGREGCGWVHPWWQSTWGDLIGGFEEIWQEGEDSFWIEHAGDGGWLFREEWILGFFFPFPSLFFNLNIKREEDEWMKKMEKNMMDFGLPCSDTKTLMGDESDLGFYVCEIPISVSNRYWPHPLAQHLLCIFVDFVARFKLDCVSDSWRYNS